MNLHPAVVGSLKSKTMWVGAALVVLSNIAPALPDYLRTLGLDPHSIQVIGSTCGMLMLILRTVTDTSLTDKGTQT